jgi:hypothetical protein
MVVGHDSIMAGGQPEENAPVVVSRAGRDDRARLATSVRIDAPSR